MTMSEQSVFEILKIVAIVCSIFAIGGMIVMAWAEKRLDRADYGLRACIVTIISLFIFIICTLFASAIK